MESSKIMEEESVALSATFYKFRFKCCDNDWKEVFNEITLNYLQTSLINTSFEDTNNQTVRIYYKFTIM
jgi:hypothetical protein